MVQETISIDDVLRLLNEAVAALDQQAISDLVAQRVPNTVGLIEITVQFPIPSDPEIIKVEHKE